MEGEKREKRVRANKQTVCLLLSRLLFSFSPKTKPPALSRRGYCCCKSLTMTYFHTGTRTIIGAESFHCPVRDGKEWDQLAMVIRHNLYVALTWVKTTNS